MKYESRTSLITKNSSTGWKGLLILLIVLGHTSLLCKYGAGGNDYYVWRQWLYEFHVQAFFILPFLYGCKKMDAGQFISETKKIFVRFYIPYIWIVGACMIIQLQLGILGDYGKAIWAVIIGSQGMLHEYLGFHFPWFLPTMFSVILIRNLYYNVTWIGKCLIVGVVILAYLTNYVAVVKYIPCNFVNAVRYAALGILVRFVITMHPPLVYLKWGCVLLFVLFSVAFFSYLEIQSGLRVIINMVIPLSFGCIVCAFQKYADMPFLRLVGKHSLQIYMFHIIVYNMLLYLSLRLFSPSLTLGIVLYTLTVFISLGMATIIERTPCMKKILFPR